MSSDRRAKERDGGGMSDHFLAEASVKVCEDFRKRGNDLCVNEVVKTSEVGKVACVQIARQT